VPAFFIGTYFGGLVGASLAWVIGYPILVVARLHFSLPPLGLTRRQYFGAMAGPALGGAVMYGTVMLVREAIAAPLLKPVAGMALLVVTGALVYFLFMWIFCRTRFLEIIALVVRKRYG